MCIDMKYLPIIFLLTCNMCFAKPDCEKYSAITFPGPNGVSLGFELKRSEILKAPMWDLVNEPPLKISEAIKFAGTAIQEANLTQRYSLDSISLQQFGCNAPDSFYYLVNYQLWNQNNWPINSYKVIIFLDGKVYKPVKVKD